MFVCLSDCLINAFSSALFSTLVDVNTVLITVDARRNFNHQVYSV